MKKGLIRLLLGFCETLTHTFEGVHSNDDSHDYCAELCNDLRGDKVSYKPDILRHAKE